MGWDTQSIGSLNMMIGILIPFLILIPTPAKACSPPLNATTFTCPPHDGGIIDTTPQEYDPVDQYESYYNMYQWSKAVEIIRDWKLHQHLKSKPPVNDMINSALIEYEYGQNGSTESEELLQLPSNRD